MEDSIYIKRLKERVRQNPNSKVFLSLAEELRKMNMIDEAMAILINGIKKNPDYISARLTIGRWYLSTGMLLEARKEFSEAIKISPDNIFARKWLDEVNRRLGVVDDEVNSLSPHTGRKAVINRLNKFLEGIKIRFGEPSSLVASPSHRDKEALVNRLERLLGAIRTHFATSQGVS